MIRYHLAAVLAATALVTNTASATNGGSSKNTKGGNNGWYTPSYKPVKSNEVFELLCSPQGPEVITPKPPTTPPLPNGSITPTPPTNVVPEPSTYALMATGLLGLGVVARRRRVQD